MREIIYWGGRGGGCDINMFEQAFTWKFLGHLPNITPAFDSRKFLYTDYHYCTDKCIPVEYSICDQGQPTDAIPIAFA